MQKIYNENREVIIKALICLGIVLFIYSLKYIFYLLSPFIIGLIIAKMLRPISNYYSTKFKVSSGISAIISLITFFLIVFLVGMGLYHVMKAQIFELVENFPIIKEEVLVFYEKIKEIFYKYVLLPEFIKDSFSLTFEGIITTVTDFVVKYGTTFATSLIKSIPTIFLNVVIGFVSSFFFLKDNDLIKENISKFTPNFVKNTLTILREKIGFAIGAYLKAQCILMSMTATIVLIGLFIIGNDYTLILALIIGIIDAIPMFGSGFVLWPWAAYSLFVGEYSQAIGLLIIYGVVFFNRQIFEPKILGVQIGLHPLLTLMSVYIGFKVFGLFGFILGPFTFIMIKTVITSELSEFGEVADKC